MKATPRKNQDADPKKVRHTFRWDNVVRKKCVSRRLLALSEGEIAAFMTATRQVGVGSQGGAWILAIFHQHHL